MTRLLLVTGISLVALILVVFFSPFSQVASINPISSKVADPTVAAHRNEMVSSATTATPISPSQIKAPSTLIDEFNTLSDGRAVAMNLWTKEMEGGRFYASAIADFCSGVSKFVPHALSGQASLDSVSSERQLTVIAAHEFIQRRCGQFTQDEFGKYSRRGLLNDKQSADPLIQAVKDFNAANFELQRDKYVKSLGRILNTQDPMLFDDVGIKLSLHTGATGPYLYFDGKSYPVRDSPAIAAAYTLVPCSLGLNCNNFDPTLTLACVSGSKCYKDRYQKIYEEIALGNEAVYAEILGFEAKLVSAIKNREIQKFLPTQ